jgi:hypothetical protein
MWYHSLPYPEETQNEPIIIVFVVVVVFASSCVSCVYVNAERHALDPVPFAKDPRSREPLFLPMPKATVGGWRGQNSVLSLSINS